MGRKVFLFFVLALFYAKVEALTYEVVREDRCQMLAYTSEKKQTDHDPFATAGGTAPKWGTVAANHLPFYTRMKIQGFGEKIFVVEDRLNKRYKKTIDIWFPNKQTAIKFGVKKLKYWIVKNVRPLPD